MIPSRALSIRVSAKSLSKRVFEAKSHQITQRLLFFTETAKPTNSPHKIVYIGEHGERIQLLKRMNLTAGAITATFLPIAFTVTDFDIDLPTKLLMSSLVVGGSLSSTFIIHLLTMTYIYHLEIVSTALSESHQAAETVKSNSESSSAAPVNSSEIVHFRASRIDFFGNEQYTEFYSNEVLKGQDVVHPIVSFVARNRTYFIDSEKIKNKKIQAIFS